jgi:hypothetical protein
MTDVNSISAQTGVEFDVRNLAQDNFVATKRMSSGLPEYEARLRWPSCWRARC